MTISWAIYFEWEKEWEPFIQVHRMDKYYKYAWYEPEYGSFSVKSLFIGSLSLVYRYLCSTKGTLKHHYGLHNHKDSSKMNCFDYIKCI